MMIKNYVNQQTGKNRLQPFSAFPTLLCLLCLLLCLCCLCGCGAEEEPSAESVPEQLMPAEMPVQEAAEEAASALEEASVPEEEASAEEKTINEDDSGSGYETAVITASALNMRAKATTDSDVVEQLTMGEKVEVIGAGNYWAKIRTDSGKTGYVSVDYLFIGEPDVEPHDIVEEAGKYLGTPYVWGGSSDSGFDCSGFTQYVYMQLGLFLPRVADDQMDLGVAVDEDDLQFGDLVFFGSGTYASHVGIYAGCGFFIHASNSGVVYTKLSKPYYAERYIGARRILEDPDDSDDTEDTDDTESAQESKK